MPSKSTLLGEPLRGRRLHIAGDGAEIEQHHVVVISQDAGGDGGVNALYSFSRPVAAGDAGAITHAVGQ